MPFRGRWQSNYVQYNIGDIVEYQGSKYEIIQPHKSQDDWPPNATPALWKNLGSDSCNNCGDQHPSNQCPQGQGDACCNKCGDAHSPYQPCHDQDVNTKPCSICGTPHPAYLPCPDKPHLQEQHQEQQQPQASATVQGGYQADNGVQVHESETKKNWFDIDDKRKQELLAGGLALGLAAIGGGLFYANKHHKLTAQQEQQQAWQVQNWLKASQQRSAQFIRDGPQGPFTWILSDTLERRSDLQHDMIRVGLQGSNSWFIIRAPYLGGIQLGKFRPSNNNAAGTIGYQHDAILVKQFEVLIGSSSSARWIPARGKLDAGDLRGARPVEGGSEDNGTPLYIARARVGNELVPGKASSVLDGAYITVGDKEEQFKDYEVLVYA